MTDPVLISTLTMFSFDGGAPWIVAQSDDAAIAFAKKDFALNYGDAAWYPPRVCRPMAPDEAFTMTYMDAEAIPSGLDRDEFECECGDISGDLGCCCEVNVTLPTSQWCEILGNGCVTGEFEA